MAFQFTFSPNQPHQIEGIAAVVDLFVGLDKSALGTFLDEIVPNAPEADDLADYWLEENLRAVQERHNEAHPDALVPVGNLEPDDGTLLNGVSNDSYRCHHFTLEMETGTGKTYVYFRTMIELYQKYGLRKFIIVVPSVAILEGVKKSFEVTKAHFAALYGVTNFHLFEYDGAQIARIGSFAKSTFPIIMVMTQQAFNSASRNFYKGTEKLTGKRRPFEWVQATRPVVVLDEPQNMGSEASKEAIRTLKPLFVLRYSATHRKGQQPNPVYRLTPVQAFRHGLVKQIQVVGVAQLGSLSANLLRLEEVHRGPPISAKVRVLTLVDGKTAEKSVTLRQNDDLMRLTGLAEHEGMKVAEINYDAEGKASSVKLLGGSEGGLTLTTNDEVVGSRVDVWRAQIEETLVAHMKRQDELRERGVKVLSLFFIDRVANYVDENGTIRRLFDETFNKLKVGRPHWSGLEPANVRAAYFAKTTKKDKDTKQERDVYIQDEGADSEEARAAVKAAFNLIMREKEILLSFPDGKEEKKNVAFIFAHSALKEGWDNPNVFQICTLNQTTSTTKKRQEIGRGLRLCVDQKGNRPEGASINVLTVVANESYENYVRNLQQDYVNDGETPPPPPKRKDEATARRREKLYNLPEFKVFWKRLNQRLVYDLAVETDALVAECISRLNAARFPEPVITVSRGRFVVTEYVVRVAKSAGPGQAQLLIEMRSSAGVEVTLGFVKPDEWKVTVAVGNDLGKKNQQLRGFRVTKIWDQFGERRVRFANDVEVSESEVYTFQATGVDNVRSPDQRIATERQPVPDFITRAAEETFLTRETLIRIFDGLLPEKKAGIFKNPEGWANTFVDGVNEGLADHVADRVRYTPAGGLLGDPHGPEDLLTPTIPYPQKEVVQGGPASLYDLVQVDSDVEREFVQRRLEPVTGDLAVYFKFPPKFKIEMPKVIHKYNPDWGLVRLPGGGPPSLELVRETKGSVELDKLRFANEGRKVRIAARYFAALGIDYRVVTGKTEAWWESLPVPTPGRRPALRLLRRDEIVDDRNTVAVPAYSLKAAAGAFLTGEPPELLGYVEVLTHRVRKGLFAAQIIGDSMDKVAPDGAWCLWQHFGEPSVAAAVLGDRLIARLEEAGDPELGGFTFKRWTRDREGRSWLSPESANAAHRPLPAEVEGLKFVARFVEVLVVQGTL